MRYAASAYGQCAIFFAIEFSKQVTNSKKTHRKGNAVNIDGHGTLARVLVVVIVIGRRRHLLLGSEGVGDAAEGIGQRGGAHLGVGAGGRGGHRRLGCKRRRRRKEGRGDAQSRDRFGADEHVVIGKLQKDAFACGEFLFV